MRDLRRAATASLVAVLFVSVLAQQKSPDPTRPRFSQASTNVFRRFAVDLAKMKEFYGEVLGLGALAAIGMPGGGQMTRFHAGTTEVKLQPSAAESQAPAGPIRDITGLRVLTFFFPDEAALTARFNTSSSTSRTSMRARRRSRSRSIDRSVISRQTCGPCG